MQMFSKPWKLKEGFLIGGIFVLIGVMFQVILGSVRWDVFIWPVNVISIGAFILLLAFAALIYEKVYIVRFLASCHAAVPAICIVALLTVCMGIIRQEESSSRDDFMGFTYALTTWPFVLSYVWMTLLLGLTIVRQILHFRIKKLPSLVCHIGLLTVLLCATLGSADIQQVSIYTEQGFVNVVYDPWQPAVFIGVIILFIGAITLFLTPKDRVKKEDGQ